VVDYSISLSTILQSLAYIGVAIGFFIAMRSDINVLKHDIEALREIQGNTTHALDNLSTILTQVAVQDNRINMLEKQIDELRHGKGLIK